MDVLVEEENKEPGYVTGRISNNITVHFKGSKDLIGKLVPVTLDDCRGFYYFGTRAGCPES
jgi:tRNA-2-methylthio-N6-dimethylallyladenosine synthase